MGMDMQAPAPAAELATEMPKPVELDEKKISAMDSVLVKLGMKEKDECEIVEEGENLMEQIKCAGRAGIVSYVIWEWIFWLTAIPIACFTYYSASGSWPGASGILLGHAQRLKGPPCLASLRVC